MGLRTSFFLHALLCRNPKNEFVDIYLPPITTDKRGAPALVKEAAEKGEEEKRDKWDSAA